MSQYLLILPTHFFIGLIVFFLVAAWNHVVMNLGTLWVVPGIFLLIFISLGHLIISAYYGCRFRDLSPALSGIFQILFYVTPIIFTPQILAARGLSFVYQFNPFYYLLEVVRYPFLHHSVAPIHIYDFCLGYGFLVWIFAIYTLFKYDKKVTFWL